MQDIPVDGPVDPSAAPFREWKREMTDKCLLAYRQFGTSVSLEDFPPT